MPLWDFNDDLEEIGENERVLRLSDFSGGIGTRWRREHQGDLKSMYGYWYGYVDTWSPGVVHLPLLSTASTTPLKSDGSTPMSAAKTDYASIIEAYIGGSRRVFLAKGDSVWATTGAAFGTAVATGTIANAQGRQLLYDPVNGAVIWFNGTGSGVVAKYSTNATSWATLGSEGRQLVCGWKMMINLDPELSSRLLGLDGSGNLWGLGASLVGAWTDTGVDIVTSPGIDVIPLGFLGDPTEYYVANGPDVWSIKSSPSAVAFLYTSVSGIYPTSLAVIASACKYEDRFALTDGSPRIILWHPTQPPIDVSLFGDDGVPDAIRGGVKALFAVGPYLLALWEMDNSAPVATANRGNSMVFWSRPNLQGQTTWHPRTGILTGGFPLSIGQPMVLAEKTIASKRRFWVCLADTTDGRAYYQDHPLAGFNPMADTASTYGYEDGPKKIYLPWRGLQLMGDEAGAMIAAECDGDLSATECVQLGYRANYETLGEEDASASWKTLPKFTNVYRRKKFAGELGVQAQAVQPYLEFDRGNTVTTTPKLRSAGILVRRCRRQPSMEAQ